MQVGGNPVWGVVKAEQTAEGEAGRDMLMVILTLSFIVDIWEMSKSPNSWIGFLNI